MKWLENDLIEANKPENRAVRPWIFMAGHRPIYYGSTVHTELQSAIEGLMYKYGVDMYLYGHVHNYQRLFPVYNSTVDPAGYSNPMATTQVLVGGTGNDEMDPGARKRVLKQQQDHVREFYLEGGLYLHTVGVLFYVEWCITKQSPYLLLSYPTTSAVSHISIILISTPKHTYLFIGRCSRRKQTRRSFTQGHSS